MTVKEAIEKAGYEWGMNNEGYYSWSAPDDAEFLHENSAFAHLVGRVCLYELPDFELSDLLAVWEAENG